MRKTVRNGAEKTELNLTRMCKTGLKPGRESYPSLSSGVFSENINHRSAPSGLLSGKLSSQHDARPINKINNVSITPGCGPRGVNQQ